MAIKRNISDLSNLKRGSTDIQKVYRGTNLIWQRNRPFIIKVNSGSNSQFTIPTTGGGYNYNLTTSDGQSFTGLTGNKLINFPSVNTDYILEIIGDFPQWFQNNNSESVKVRDIMQWGYIKWSSFASSFYGCSNLTSSATDKPDLSNVTTMSSMFANSSFNSDISGWDVSNVTNMGYMFRYSSFNSDISGWDVSNVTFMNSMFFNTPFNQDIGGWDVSNVTSMTGMFGGSQFNQNISGWNVTKVTSWIGFRSDCPLTTANTPPKFR